MSKVKVTKDKSGIFGPFGGLRAVLRLVEHI